MVAVKQFTFPLVCSASQVTVQNVIFQGCKGEIAAVIVQPEGDNSSSEDLISSVLFSGVEFRKNEVTGFFAYMGCLAITQASVSIEDSVFSENLAALGAAISVQSGLLSVTNSIFTRNVAGEVGGAIYVNGQGILTQAKDGILSKGLSIDKCIFEGNIAKSDVPGSMITKRNGGPLEPLTFYTFPLAHGQGGAISIVDVAGVDITNSTFRGNQAPSGGALFLQLETESPESPKSKIVISNCTFNSNAAVFPEGNNDEEDEFAFEKDYDTLNGGAIFAVVGEIDALFSLEGSTFVDNTAQSGGGLHVVTSDTVEVSTVKIEIECVKIPDAAICNHHDCFAAKFACGEHASSKPLLLLVGQAVSEFTWILHVHHHSQSVGLGDL